MSASLTTGKKVAIAAVSVVAIIVFSIVAVFGWVNGIRSDGIAMEKSLSAKYSSNQNELSSYVLTITESLGVADKGSERLEEILTEAVQGRYDGEMQPGTGGAMFSAIAEAYPDLTATTAGYDKVQDLVASGRAGFKNKQDRLLDEVRAYETWSEQDIVRSMALNTLGFPTKNLEARISDDVVTGDAALERMKKIVLADQAKDSFETGTDTALIAPEGK